MKKPKVEVVASTALVESAANTLILRALMEMMFSDATLDQRRKQIYEMIAKVERLAVATKGKGFDQQTGGRLSDESKRAAQDFLVQMLPRDKP